LSICPTDVFFFFFFFFFDCFFHSQTAFLQPLLKVPCGCRVVDQDW
jgi:hypothetical protein